MLICEGRIGDLYELNAGNDVSCYSNIDSEYALHSDCVTGTVMLLEPVVPIRSRIFAKVLLPSGVAGYIWRNAIVHKLT